MVFGRLSKKNHHRKVGNGTFDSSREGLSYQTIKKFAFLVADYLKIFYMEFSLYDF